MKIYTMEFCVIYYYDGNAFLLNANDAANVFAMKQIRRSE